MSNNRHHDAAKMRRKASKAEARLKAFTLPSGHIMSHRSRRAVQREAVFHRSHDKAIATDPVYGMQRIPKNLSAYRPDAILSDGRMVELKTVSRADAKRIALASGLTYSSGHTTLGELLDKSAQAETGNLLAEKRDKAPPRMVDPLRSERAKRAAATRKANKAKASE